MSTSPVTTSVNHDDSDQLIICFFNLDLGIDFPIEKGGVTLFIPPLMNFL